MVDTAKVVVVVGKIGVPVVDVEVEVLVDVKFASSDWFDMVQLLYIVFDTSRGMINIMRKEKYQATRTAKVTKTGCLIQFEYLDNRE